MWFFVVLSFILLLICFFYQIEIWRMGKHLTMLNKGTTKEPIKVLLISANIENLAEQINAVVKEKEQKQEALKERENELKQSIANISHDFCTPLTSVSGYLQLLQNDSELTEKSKKYVNAALGKAEFLNKLIKNYFDLSMYELEDYHPDNERINICEAVSVAILESEIDFKRESIDVEVTLPDTAIWIFGDNIAVKRIIVNLITNAIKYSDKRVRISLSTSKDVCKLCVENNTLDLSPIHIDRLFDRFYTVNEARYTTGLGLSIVKTLVNKMNGNIICNYNDHWLAICVEFPLSE